MNEDLETIIKEVYSCYDEELKKAIDIIINKPIIIQKMTGEDNIVVYAFNKENFETLEQTYYNCQYFARNQEQLMINLKDKDKEIKRLNNIINELEKWLKQTQLLVLRNDNQPVYKYQEVLDKLKELKENK